jgi:hypothetical protein
LGKKTGLEITVSIFHRKRQLIFSEYFLNI